jgi:hypothetical protein
VSDEPKDAREAAASLVAAGVGVAQVKVLDGATAEGPLSDLPTSKGAFGQLIRLVQLVTTDRWAAVGVGRAGDGYLVRYSADPTRVRILQPLSLAPELCVYDLVPLPDLSVSALTH